MLILKFIFLQAKVRMSNYPCWVRMLSCNLITVVKLYCAGCSRHSMLITCLMEKATDNENYNL